jgi:hypothetical protein
LTDRQKSERLDWCHANRNNDFRDWIFTDETSVWVNQPPLYHMRLVGSRPDALQCTSKSRSKIQCWGGISVLGPTPFQVKLFKDGLVSRKFFFNRFYLFI